MPLFASAAFKGTSRAGIYGDVVEELDWSVGQILDTLRREGIANRTHVIGLHIDGRVGQCGGDRDLCRAIVGTRDLEPQFAQFEFLRQRDIRRLVYPLRTLGLRPNDQMIARAEAATATEIDVPPPVHPRTALHASTEQQRDQKERAEVPVGHQQVAG